MEDIVRVLRIIEYVGPRSKVEKQVGRSIGPGPTDFGNGVTIRTAVLGQYPECLVSMRLQVEGNEQAKAVVDGTWTPPVDLDPPARKEPSDG